MFKRVSILVFLLTVLAVSGVSSAQGDDLTAYQNSVFTVSVPTSLEIQNESDTEVTFTADVSSIEITPVSLSEDVQATLQMMGDLQSSFASIMEIAFAASDYTTIVCETTLPCVEFIDMYHTDGIVLRATIANPNGSVIYSIAFHAPDDKALAELQPDAVISSFEFAGETATTSDGAVQFNVAAQGSVNLRDCAGTECGIVGQTTNGQVLGVLATEGDWYLVQWEDGTAYIASWLTTRGPDVHVDLVTDTYTDPITGCMLGLFVDRGETDFNVILTGEGQDEIWADVYRPGESRPVSVDAQYDKTFIDTEEPYIHQTYSWGEYWPMGTYQVEVEFGGNTSMIAFDVETEGDQNLYVVCD